jgi:hypothetical protein
VHPLFCERSPAGLQGRRAGGRSSSFSQRNDDPGQRGSKTDAKKAQIKIVRRDGLKEKLISVNIVRSYGDDSSLQITGKVTHFRESSKGAEAMEQSHSHWCSRIPADCQGADDWVRNESQLFSC